MTLTDLYGNLFGKNHIQDGDVIEMAEHGRVGGLSTGQGLKYIQVLNSGGSIVDSFGGSSSALATVTAQQGSAGAQAWLVTMATLSVVTQAGAGALATLTTIQGDPGAKAWLVTQATLPVSFAPPSIAGGSLTTYNAGGSLTAYQGSSPWSMLNAGGSSSSYVAGGSLTAFQGASPWGVAAAGGSFTAYPGNVPNTVAWLVTMGTTTANQGLAGTSAWLVTQATLPVFASQAGTWTVQPGNTPNTVGWLVTLATISSIGAISSLPTLSVMGNIAHASADASPPIKIGARALASPKGVTTVADANRTDLFADIDGIQMVKLNTSNADIISERISTTGSASTKFATFASVAALKNYVTGYSVWNSSAVNTYVDIQDGSGGAILWTIPLPAGGGANLANSAPLFHGSVATALAYQVNASASTVYLSLSGFQSKV